MHWKTFYETRGGGIKSKWKNHSLEKWKPSTFRFNSKSSLLKLLCTLARFCEGNPLQLFRLDFLSHPRSQSHKFHFSHFSNRTREKARKYHERAPLPNLPTPMTLRPKPYPHVSTAKVISMPRRAISRCRAPQEECLPWFSQKLFSIHSPCSYFAIASTREGGGRD